MAYKYFLFCALVCPIAMFAQKHDNIWLFGLGGGVQSPLNDEWGATLLDFSNIDKPEVIEKQEYAVNFTATDASICDSMGNLLFYTNGEKVYGPNHLVMENGSGIAFANADGYGLRSAQSAIVLPYPEHPSQYLLITVEDYEGYAFGWNLFSHLIDMSANNGLGKVVEKRNLLLQDAMAWGKITAVKHANGRDWWFVIPQDTTNGYFIGLLDPSGIKMSIQYVGGDVWDGLGQAVFSPNGERYIRVDDRTTIDPSVISIMDFDRCTGQLSNFQTNMFSPSTATFGVGVSVSPNSRYLYVTNTTVAYQYDLKSDDIFSTQTLVAQLDGFMPNHPVFFLTNQLGPDGRIYVQALNQGFYFHYIDFPNRSGETCRFVQHGIQTETLIAREIPNFPNYRLGPLDGSACDTLGFDNHPLCNWRWEQEDTLAPLQVTFTDLSDYEPAEWHWDFDDPASGGANTSQDTSPVHTFSAEGVYNVCLVVSNQYSADTLCRVLNLGVSGVGEADAGKAANIFQVMPNPADNLLHIVPNFDLQAETQFELFGLLGQRVWHFTLPTGISGASMNTSSIASGVYLYKISGAGKTLHCGKLVISH